VVVFGGIILIMGILAYKAKTEADQEKSTATTFVNKVLADDPTTTYNMFTTSAQNDQSPDDWGVQVDKLSGFFGNKQPSFQKSTTSGTQTSLTYTISGKDGDYVMTVILEHTKSGVQVQSFTSLLSLQ
jgi:hypothetical protein